MPFAIAEHPANARYIRFVSTEQNLMPRKRTSPIDTHPSALQQQVEMLREATCAQRFAAVRSLSATVASLSRRALRRNMPDAPENEIDLAFVALHYGDALAARVRARSERGT